jgi:hypothetical protein
MTKFVCDLRQVGGFLQALPPIKLTTARYIVKSGVKHHKPKPIQFILYKK